MNYPAWHARASSLGAYNACTMRAWLDHAMKTGRIQPQDWGFDTVDDTNTSSVPADWGTCCHWHAQKGAKCYFPPEDDWNRIAWQDPTTPSALFQQDAAKYTDAQWDNGKTLFPDDGTAQRMLDKIAAEVPKHLPENKRWIAESCFDIPGRLKGHIDFLSHDYEVLVDLKTTSKKPPYGRPKIEHIWQIIGYALGVLHATGSLPKYGYFIYAHSRGEWCFRTKPIEFHKPMVQGMMSALASRLDLYSNYDALAEAAIPNPGSACDNFCPYTKCCRDEILPRGTAVRDLSVDIDMPKQTNPFGG